MDLKESSGYYGSREEQDRINLLLAKQAARTPKASAFLVGRRYRQFPATGLCDWATSAWQREALGVREYSEGENKFYLTLYIAHDPFDPKADPTFEVRGYGELEGFAHDFKVYGLPVSEIEDLIAPAENNVLAMWRAISEVKR